MEGKFIVLEGIDGAGGETQSKLLKKELEEAGYQVLLLSYPDYEGPIGKLLHDFLHGKYELSPEVQLLLYSADMIKDMQRIKQAIREGRLVISDRYFYLTTLAYQCLKGADLEKALSYAKLFGILVPDLIIFLDVSPETSIKRKYEEKGELDLHEKDEGFLKKLSKFFKQLIDQGIGGKVETIDGEKSIEEVAEEIRGIVSRNLGIKF
jgi:dTMP kinase